MNNTGMLLLIVLVLMSWSRIRQSTTTKKAPDEAGLLTGSVYTLKNGYDSTHAVVGDSTTFNATKGRLMLYSYRRLIIDGRYNHIPSNFFIKADTSCFKFNFFQWKYPVNKYGELNTFVKMEDYNLTDIMAGFKHKHSEVMRQYFKLGKEVDGTAAEEYFQTFGP